jgi:hypothetical protein
LAKSLVLFKMGHQSQSQSGIGGDFESH